VTRLLNRYRWRAVLLLLGAVVVVVVAVAVAASRRGEAGCGPSSGRSPAQISARSGVTRHFEYVLTEKEIHVYDIDHGNRLVQTICVPVMVDPYGAVAIPATGMLYVADVIYVDNKPTGAILAYDLRRSRVVSHRGYPLGTDSMGITPDGRTIYMPQGEQKTTSRTWNVIDTATGRVTGSIQAGSGPHNTIVGLDGKYVYLGGVEYPYLVVASTATNKVVREIGPLHGPGVRPFTINGSQTLAFTTARSFLGFQVSSIKTGKVLYSVAPPGFSFDLETFGRTPNHGISLSPDERELYLIDTPNGYVHVFDVSGLPKSAPRNVADIKMAHPPPNDGWLQHSRDGRYVYVGRAGDVIDTRTRKVVAFLPPMQETADFLEIDWRKGRPVSTTNRYGIGYVRRKANAAG
jgi:DNA-binding beta-propeller fold protein YncE